MPSPWKRSRLSRLVSSLRPKCPPPDSPLLVQTGFPTSLADLVVKNRSRIHHRRRKSTASAAPAPAPLASFASQIADAVDPPDDPPALDAPPPPAAEPEAPAAGVACQAKLVLVLALAVCTRELVLGVTLSALLLLLFESAGSWLHARSGAEPPPASAVRAESSDLGRRDHWNKAVAETLRRPTRRKDPIEPGLDPNYNTRDSTSPEEGIEPDPNWRRTITITGPAFLLVTALSGLAGGKLVAVALTVAGCYLMRAPSLAKIKQSLLAGLDGGG